ncbi:hypothetical protein [Blastochloris tepida]|uniref:hypothetical protein n=1 Tax=Blastochloris tepida TaxID=2233851 RepID=UPI000F818C90|nr:hypothetical protein [Blastochloris tepida]
MDDSSYKDALKLRDTLRAQMRALEQQAEIMKRQLNTVESYIRLYEDLKSKPPGTPAEGAQLMFLLEAESKQRRRRSGLTPTQIADLAREVLGERGIPMTRGELVTAIESRGVLLPGKDKSKNLGTILWRFSDRFRNIEGRGYWPTDLPEPD